jgi:hypothetical protein
MFCIASVWGGAKREKKEGRTRNLRVCAADYNQSLIFPVFDKKATPA